MHFATCIITLDDEAADAVYRCGGGWTAGHEGATLLSVWRHRKHGFTHAVHGTTYVSELYGLPTLLLPILGLHNNDSSEQPLYHSCRLGGMMGRSPHTQTSVAPRNF